MKKNNGIIIVSFGTGKEEDFKKYLLPFKDDIENNYKNFKVNIAFTSNIMVKKLNSKIKNYKDTLEEFKKDGIENLYILPLYFGRGLEYRKIISIADEYIKYFKVIKIGKPLFEEKFNLVEDFFNRYKNILFICHGAKDSSNCFEEEFIKNEIKRLGKENGYVALINKKDEFKTLVKNINKDEELSLVPILITKGYHFKEDILNSENKESFLSIINNENIKVKVIDEALSENKLFRELILEKVDDLIGKSSN